MLTVVIPTYQRSDLLELCLDSVMRHQSVELEVVVVDDAAPNPMAGAVARRFRDVRVVRRSKRGGFAAAANDGIRTARGEIVQLLNDDTEVMARWAETPLRRFADPSIGAVAPLVLAWPDGKTIDSAGDRYDLGGFAAKRGHDEPFGPAFTRPCNVFGASASSAFYRRSALFEVGLFPESFGSYFEDVDLAFRLQRAGYRAWYEPDSRVLHRMGASHGRPGRRLLEQQARNEERVFWRNVPASAMWRAFPRHLAVLAGKALRRMGEGTIIPWTCGKLSLLAEVRELRAHRRALRETWGDREPSEWGMELASRRA